MKNFLVILAVILCFSACKKIDLYHDLTEGEANEMIVVLQQEGISVNKVKEVRQNEIYWTVQVDQKRVKDARRLLVEHKLPRKRELGLSGVYKEKGLIPTPDEQKARFMLALKGEIINSLMRLPDVVDADVIINAPTAEEFADPEAKEKRPTASVVIKAKPSDSSQETLSEAKIQQFVANAVENLNPRDVSVIISYITQPRKGLLPGQSLILPNAADAEKTGAPEEKPVTRIAGLEVVGESQGRLKIYLAIFFVILAALAAALVVTVIRTSRMRQQGPKGLVDGGVVEEQPKLTDGKR